MLNILLVDDDILIHHLLNTYISSYKKDFKVVSSIYDASRVLPFLQQNPLPDLIILDIEMPHISGIELTRNISKHYPSINIIILSNYDNFDYAQSIMQSGITQYLLKHSLTSTKLLEVLKHYESKIDSLKKQQEKISYINSVSNPLLLNQILSKPQTSPELRDTFFELEMFSHSSKCIITIQIVNFILLAPQKDSDKRAALIEHITQLLTNICYSTNSIVTSMKDGAFVILACFNHEHSEHIVQGKVTHLMSLIKHNLQKLIAIQCLISNSPIFYNIQEMNDYYQIALNTLQKDIITSSTNSSSLQAIPLAVEQELIDCLKMGDKDTLYQLLQNVTTSFIPPNLHYEEVQYLFLDLLKILFRLMREKGIADSATLEQDCINKLKSCTSIDLLKTQVIHLFIDYCERFLSPLPPYSPHVLYSINYIKNNYKHNISLSNAAAACHLNAAYLSKIFKQDTGVGFVDYLNDYRIKHAQYLMKYKHLKIKDICMQSGFNNISYFNKVFKEKTSLTPIQYIQQLK